MNFDWAEWGPPLAVLAFGVAAGTIAALRLKMQEDASVTDQGREQDLIQAHQAAVEALKSLELDQGKLDPADYAREREALVTRGASALRELEAFRSGATTPPAPSTASPEETAAAPPVQASQPAQSAPPPAPASPPERPLISPEWKGALTALAVVALVALLVQFAGGESVPRREGASMTGNQDLGVASTEPGTRPPWHDAKVALEKRLEQNPGDLATLNELTQLSLSIGDPSSAMEYNQRVLGSDPDNIDGRVYKGVLAAYIGMHEQALGLFDGVLAEVPSNMMALTYKGLVLLEDGRAEEAVPVLEQAVAAQPNVPQLRQELERARAIARGEAPPPRPGPPPDHPGQAPSSSGQMPPGHPPTGQAPAAGAGEVVVSGVAHLDEAKAAALTGREVLYVSLRAPEGGPPLAAKRLSPGPFPKAFEITTADAIAMGGQPRPFPATMNLTIRIDRDGNAMTKEPDEPAAEMKNVGKGSRDLELRLQ